MILICAVNKMVIKTACESDIEYCVSCFHVQLHPSIQLCHACLKQSSKQLKALTHYTQNCKDFPKKIVVKIVAHI